MWYAVLGATVVVLALTLLLRWRGTPSAAMLGRVAEGVAELQRKALQNVLPADRGLSGFDPEAMSPQTMRLFGAIRFIYTVEQEADDFVHVISSQLTRRKSRRYQIECMLIVMLLLSRQLTDAGIKPEDVQFQVEESDRGTHFVAMELTRKQHSSLVQQVLAEARR